MTIRLVRNAALAATILVSTALQAQDTEQLILDGVDAELESARALLQRSVEVNSGTMNFAGVRANGNLLAPEFSKLGFDVAWIDGAPFNRAGHLVARLENGGLRLLLIGHLDTVFAIDSPFQNYLPLPGDRVKGPGITDMKGGNVIMLTALKALDAAGLLDRISVHAILTGDEESRGRPLDIATRELVDSARWADIALGFEDGDGNPETAVISRRSASSWSLVVTGTPAHSSQIFQPDIGYGAVFEAARILDGFRTSLEPMQDLTFNPGVLVGGTDIDLDGTTKRGTAFGKTNVIARSLKARGDLRAVSPEQLAAARSKMREIVAGSLPGTTAELVFSDSYPPMAPTVANRKLLEIYSRVSSDLGYGPVAAVNPRNAGAADISFAAAHVDMALDGLGLMGTGGHTDNEIADMTTLESQAKRAAILIYRLSQRASSP
ncbi:MAG: M20/M25/M40 family metallo-hydrolase [Xanthomonadales bacterium]|nr:M20/M25/M40 family metallo-hydrolase [Xanthomonadales bacterium]